MSPSNDLRPGAYVDTAPDRPAVITSSGRRVTFAELEERSCRLAQALYAHGLRSGDHVAVVLPNDDRTHEVAFGLQRSGLYYTMVNTHLAADEAAYIVNDCGARTLITSSALAPLAADLIALTPTVDLRLMIGAHIDGYRSYDDFVAGHRGTPLDDEQEGSAMLYSSGTTGHPKGIRRPLSGKPFGSDAVLAPMLSGVMGFAEGDVYLSPAPLYHSAPLVWSMTVHPHGGHRRRHGALRPRGVPGPDRVEHGSPTPSSSPPCSCACSSCSDDSAGPTTCRPSARSCTRPPRAHPR